MWGWGLKINKQNEPMTTAKYSTTVIGSIRVVITEGIADWMTWDIHPRKCQILNTSILQLRQYVILRFAILTAVD